MVATGPHVSVNTIIGLPFIKGVGMTIDTVDDVAECKYLDCPPFPIDYRRTSNQVPVIDEPGTPIHHAQAYLQDTIREIENLEHYYDTKVQGQGLRLGQKGAVHFDSVTLRVIILHQSPSRVCLPVGFLYRTRRQTITTPRS
jgi:hypothetical protein